MKAKEDWPMNKGVRQVPEELKLLHERVEQWRQTRQRLGPMPEELWQEAARMAEKHRPSLVAGFLGLGYVALKNRMVNESQQKDERIAADSVQFIELQREQDLGRCGSLVDSSPISIELTDPSGYRLKLQFSPNQTAFLGPCLRQVWELRKCCK
jgi:hypothetical protein